MICLVFEVILLMRVIAVTSVFVMVSYSSRVMLVMKINLVLGL